MDFCKKHGIKFAGMFLLALLAVSFFAGTSASAAEYPDVKGHWAEEAIERWSDTGVLKGYSNGNFGPNDNVTRAQLAEVLYRIWGCQPKSGHPYSDLPSTEWYYEGLSTMNAYGVALNRGDRIYPDEELTREEAFFMVAKAFRIGGDSDRTGEIEGVSDATEIDSAFFGRIFTMFKQKFLKGASDGAFHPKAPVTRAEVIQVIDNMFDVYIGEPGRYTVAANQVALVACGGVTIDYTPTPNYQYYTVMGKVYLMAGAEEDGVTFAIKEFEGHSLTLEVCGVSEGGLSWTQEGLHSVSDKRLDLTDPKQVPDLRFAGGIGTKRSPYLIETAEQFRLLERFPSESNTNVYFDLQNDIELPGNQKGMGGSVMTPHLNGNGHTLTYHMTEDSDVFNSYGLFRLWDGYCSDLTLEGTIDLTIDEPVRDDAISVGGLASDFGGTAVNCTSNMAITIHYPGGKADGLSVGGLAGNVYSGSRENCTFGGSVTVKDAETVSRLCVGGLAGEVSEAAFLNCTATGSIDVDVPATVSDLNVGGLVGFSAPRATIESRPDGESVIKFSKTGITYTGCGSTAALSVRGGDHSSVGGLIGILTYPTVEKAVPEEIFGTVEGCWSTAQVSSTGAGFQNDCGGIVGHLEAGTVRGSWAKPTVTVADGEYKNAGGIVGACYKYGVIKDCWANASGVEALTNGGHYGGIAGRIAGKEISNCFVLGTSKFAAENAISYASWTEVPVTACMDMTGTAQAQRDAFYRSCGWDFTSVWDKNGTYPILRSCDKAAQQAAQI